MKPFRIFPLFFLLVVLIGQTSAYSQILPKTIVVWFVGLGTGANPEQVVVEKKVVEKFNLSQDKIELRLYVTGMHVTPDDNIRTLIAAGSPPDIIGPVGFNSANIFEGYWLDLQPFVDKTGYNLKQFPENVVALHREPAGLIGIPFAAFPGVMYYNVELFDKAGLTYPPTKFGEKYKLDGKELDWDYDTVALLAKRLTLDDKGATPNDPGFDPSRMVQFGFAHQWDTMRSDFSTFGGGALLMPMAKYHFPRIGVNRRTGYGMVSGKTISFPTQPISLLF